MKHQVVASIIFAVASASTLVATAPLAIASAPTPPVTSPAPSPAPIPPRDRSVTYTYKIEITIDSTGTNRHGGGAIDEGFGILELTFNRDGNITGTYRSDVAPSIRITGGRIGPTDVWIAIGINHFDGRFTVGGLALTTPVFVPRSGPLVGHVLPYKNVDLIATFLHAGPPAP